MPTNKLSRNNSFAASLLMIALTAPLSGCLEPKPISSTTREKSTSPSKVVITEQKTVIEALPPPDSGLLDNYNISQNEYRVNAGFIEDGILRLGDGLDLSVPDDPKRRAVRSPLALEQNARLGAGAPEDYTLSEFFQLKQSSSTREEAKTLSAYFQGSYGFVSGSAALDTASKEKSQSVSIYALLESRGEVHDLGTEFDGPALVWREDEKPLLEGRNTSDEDFRRQFLLDYGSHYVSAITYGYRIGIRGKLRKSDSSKSSSVSAAFKAAFLSGGAEGGIDAKTKETLSSSELELLFEATSGGLYENGKRIPGVLTKLEDILETLQKMRDGTIQIRGAPLHASARTYWNLIPPEYGRSRSLLNSTADGPSADPLVNFIRGAIVAWSPTGSSIYEDDEGKRHIRIPQGWALCDGTEGTPDLRDKFVAGTDKLEEVLQKAGTGSHKHTAKTKGSTPNNPVVYQGATKSWPESVAGAGHHHNLTTGDASNLPPHIKLVYLMKK